MDNNLLYWGIGILVAIIIGYIQIREAKKQNELTKLSLENKKPEPISNTEKQIDLPELPNESKKQTVIQEMLTGNVINISSEIPIEEMKINSNDYRKKPTPKEIYKTIADTPPYNQKEIGKSFIKIKVVWDLSFYSMRHDKNNIYSLKFYSVDVLGVSCNTDITEYPEFKILKRNQKVRVYGEIASVETVDFELTDCYFEFLDLENATE